jgi:hypothetical protein
LLEEEIFYAACREAGVEDSLLDEAQVEHDSAKLLISALLQAQPDGDYYDARMTVLAEYIKHHVGEEEKAGSGIFARARAAKLDMNALGQRLQQRREELMRQAQGGELAAPAPRSFDLQAFNRGTGKQEQSTMARQNDRDRDEQGRFTSDEDDRGGGRGYSARNNERDDRGRFMSDDERGGGGNGGNRSPREDESRYSSRGGERGGYESRSGSQGRGQGGWSGDSEGQRGGQEGWESRGRSGSSSRYGSEEDYGSSRGGYESRSGSQGRGQGGWSGDSEGQRGGQEGWENRGRSGSSSRQGNDEDYGSSRGGNESRGGSQGRGQGGWFGDSEGHSRASQEGWENRGRSGSSSRYEDEDDSRSPRSGSGSGSGSQGRGQGGNQGSQGGWFGDPRGHSEASRRGWQNR